jgi:GMP synthase-like glutamine amidotransferase
MTAETAKTALVIEHDHASFPGPVGERLVERGYRLDELVVVPEERFHSPGVSADYPAVGEHDVIVAMGAPWSAYDHGLIGSWLDEEIALLGEAHRAGVPILAICFGAQALARALGGRAEKTPAGPEIGWYEIETDEPSTIPPGPWFQWHFDRFGPPPGARVLARSAVGPQAYAIGRSLATQFHPELNSSTLEAWLSHGGDVEARAHGFDPEELRTRTRDLAAESRARARALTDTFLNEFAERGC